MSVTVSYPVELKQYEVSVGKELATITFHGLERTDLAADPNPELRRVGEMVFGDPNPISEQDFTTRGGFLHMDRPLEMFAGVVSLLVNVQPLYLHGDGTLSNSSASR